MKRVITIIIAFMQLMFAQASSHIILTNDTENTRQAAMLLQRFVGEACGANLQIESAPTKKPSKGDILFCKPSSDAAIGEDGFALKTENGILSIITNDDCGASLGAARLLENYFGVHYLAYKCYVIDSTRAVTAKGETLVFPDINVSETPAFRYRQTHSYGNDDPVYRQWFGLEEPKDEFIDNLWVHTFNRILPAKRFGREHPEWYSFLNGERRPGDHSQWCLSNPEVLEACCHQLDSIFRANPDRQMISVSQNDGNNTYCQCPECLKIYEEEGAVSGAYIRFMNKLAERFPDKQISTLAYLFTCQPPKKVRPRENVNIMLCDIDCKRQLPLADNPGERWFVDALEGWSELSDNLFVWDYGINFDNIVSPFPNFHVLQSNIQLFHRSHTKMHFAQVNGIKGGDFSEMRAYMIARLMQNPYQDADSLMQTFMRHYYGEAAPMLYQYQKIMQGALLASHIPLWIYDSPISHKSGMLCPELIQIYDRLFDEAEDAVANDTERLEHVRLSRLTLQYSKLEIARTQATGEKSLIPTELQLFQNRTEHFAVQSLNERNNRPADYCQLYRKRFLPQEKKSLALGATIEFAPAPEGAQDENSLLGGKPDKRYQPIAGTALCDGLYGGTTYVESWVGWCGRNADFILDLGEVKEISEIDTDFLHQLGAWILLPKGGQYWVSADKKDWQDFGRFSFAEDRDLQVKFVSGQAKSDKPVKARYIKVHIDTLGLCPDWHYGVGYPAWFFLDEVNVY